MKDLWLGHLSRPDLIKPITDLATKVKKWSKNQDKQLFCLICYLDSTSHYRLSGKVGDPSDKLKLLLFVDADLAGDSSDTKSRSGGYLVLAGPNTWFPICWVSRKQTATSRSTTEAEVVALAVCLFSEAIPTLQLFDLLEGVISLIANSEPLWTRARLSLSNSRRFTVLCRLSVGSA